MEQLNKIKTLDIKSYIEKFCLEKQQDFFTENYDNKTEIEYHETDLGKIPKYINEFWTSGQRQASSIHEISYRACFKAQLPRFFIKLLTKKGDIIYDPFAGRGTTVIEAALLGRRTISNDINPVSKILTLPRLNIPDLNELKKRLYEIPNDNNIKADIDLSMFYCPKTELEILTLKKYLQTKKEEENEDYLDYWIRMVATNRLTGHSPGFFSVYTLPPNQAITPERQKRINEQRKQIPEYRDTRKLILRKSESLLKNISSQLKNQLAEISKDALFLTKDARYTNEIKSDSIQLTVTSPPFLDVVQYVNDNWLRCWFNDIDSEMISKKITITKSIDNWCNVMLDVFKELYRITKREGWIAFEVGEVRNGKIKLEEYVVPLGIKVGFKCEAIIINRQSFTKTSNIWGVNNNNKGTNSNRIVIFKKI